MFIKMQRRVTEMDQRCRRKLDGRGQCESNIKVKSPMFALKNFNGQRKRWGHLMLFIYLIEIVYFWRRVRLIGKI